MNINIKKNSKEVEEDMEARWMLGNKRQIEREEKQKSKKDGEMQSERWRMLVQQIWKWGRGKKEAGEGRGRKEERERDSWLVQSWYIDRQIYTERGREG